MQMLSRLGTMRTVHVVTALVVAVIVVNTYLFLWLDGVWSTCLGLWKFSLDADLTFYVLDAEWAKTNPDSNDFIRQSKALPLDPKDVLKEISTQLLMRGGSWKDEIEDTLQKEYSEGYKKQIYEDLKAKALEEYASFRFMQLEKSHQILQEKKNKYFQDTHDEGDFDRRGYLRFLVGDLILPLGPNSKVSPGEGIFGLLIREVRKPKLSRKFLTEDRAQMSEESFNEAQKKHDELVRKIRLLDFPATEMYAGDGIAMSANKKHLPGALVTIGQIRALGNTLPIELVVDTKGDYNRQACEEILPQLNARCIILRDELGAELYKKVKHGGFHLKVLSLLVTSFDNTIFVDADNLPIEKDLALFFALEPYLRTKFLLWPDAWHKGTLPLFYQIARLEPGELVRRYGWPNDKPFGEYMAESQEDSIMFHDFDGIPPDIGAETGQMVFSKRLHYKSLLLSVYYNLFSKVYYPLLYQGVFGEGDRETFMPALHVMEEPYYMSEIGLRFLGIERTHPLKGELYFEETTMAQTNPIHSHEFGEAWRKWLRLQGLDTRLYPFQDNEYTLRLLVDFFDSHPGLEPKSAFLHVHNPKINPLLNEVTMRTKHMYDGRYIRKIGEYDFLLGSTDWELRFHALSEWVVCEALTDDGYWRSFDLDRLRVCDKVLRYVELLKKDSNDVGAADIHVGEFNIL